MRHVRSDKTEAGALVADASLVRTRLGDKRLVVVSWTAFMYVQLSV
jgi:hypothetical protein